MDKYLDFLLFSYSGRIGRMPFWLGLIALCVVQYLVNQGLLALAMPGIVELVAAHPEPTFEVFQEILLRTLAPTLIVSLVFFYPNYAICAKRWHDRGKSGWWSLIVLIPIIGALWMLVECGFLAGTEGSNAYGPDPAFA